MHTDPRAYCLLEGLKLLFDSISIHLNQQNEVLSPVTPSQAMVTCYTPFGHFSICEREYSSFIEYGPQKFIQSVALLLNILQKVFVS
jgi:hypothetical protein